MRLKIGFIVHDYNHYMGHSAYVAELASRLKLSHEVHVFADTFDEPDPSHIHFHRVPAFRRNALASILSFVPSASLNVRGSFDILHAQGLCGLNHNVATAHICLPAWFASLERERQPITWKQSIFKALVTPLERKALASHTTKRVIAVSHLIKRNLSQYYHRSSGVDVVYHGVNSQRFHPDNRARFRSELRRRFGNGENDFIAIYVGDLQKGAAAAIQAISRSPGVELWCVSASDTANYRALAGSLGIEGRVKYFPRTKNIEQFFAAADALVFPTLYDSFGLVITEAMASGLPVITSSEAGASELISTGIDGIVTQSAWDSSEIASFLMALRDDPAQRARIGEAARKRIEHFTWDRTAEQTLAVYQALRQENN